MKTRSGYHSEQIRNLAYLDILELLNERQKVVYQIIVEFYPISTEEIAEILGVYPNYITGRVYELRDELKLIELHGFGKSAKSGKSVSLWKPKQIDPQMAFNF